MPLSVVTGPSTLWRGYLLLFAGMSVVGSYVAFSKPLTAVFPLFLLATLRFAIAAVLMVPWLLERQPTGDRGLTKKTLGWTLFAQSFFGNFLFSICMLAGVARTSAAAAGVILACLPAAVALLSWAWLKEQPNARIWTAIGLSVMGISLLSLARSDTAATGTAPWVGNLLVVACMFCEAIYVILGKRLTASMSPKRISALINLIGLGLMLPLGIWQAIGFDFAQVRATDWALLVAYAIAASMLSTWLWLSGLKHVPASQSGVFTIALPLTACGIAVAFLGETFSALHGLAFALACAGVLIATWPVKST